MRILVTGGTAGQRVGELGLDSSTLPFELQCVLHLPQYPRHCLVLRVLVWLPRETCARLLRSELNQIDEGTHAGLSDYERLWTNAPPIIRDLTTREVSIAAHPWCGIPGIPNC